MASPYLVSLYIIKKEVYPGCSLQCRRSCDIVFKVICRKRCHFEIPVTSFHGCGPRVLRLLSTAHTVSRGRRAQTTVCGGSGYLLRGCVFAARRQLYPRPRICVSKRNLTTLLGARKTLVQRPTISYADSYHTRR